MVMPLCDRWPEDDNRDNSTGLGTDGESLWGNCNISLGFVEFNADDLHLETSCCLQKNPLTFYDLNEGWLVKMPELYARIFWDTNVQYIYCITK